MRITSLIKQFTIICVAAAFSVSVAGQAAEIPSYSSIDVIGRGLATTLDQELQQPIRAFAKDGLFWITGTIKPYAKASYKVGSLKNVSVRNETGPGAEFHLTVIASAKLDVGTGFATKKIAKVNTVQELVIRFLPIIQNGLVGVVGEVEVISATATREGQAHQKDAEKFCETIRATLISKINKRLNFVPIH